jgi:DmsE family decaheme c-type cytochrome
VNRDTALSRLVAAALTAATLALCLIVLGSGPLAASGEGAVPGPQQEAAPPTQRAADAAPAQSGYVGPETCLTCHDTATLHGTAHGNARIPGSPAADKGCESCHGPGQAHVEDDAKGHILKFSQMPARQVSDTCLTCHNKTEHAMWDSSSHAARNMGCVSCHSVHAPKSERGQLVKANQLELCATCHKPQAHKQLRSSHMPVREGKMTCTSCHNPHGSTNVRMLRVGNYINESCSSCHTEKRGPFLWEHAAGRESCVTCHDPHGSNNDRMLVVRTPMLCQRCHIGTRHPSTIYEGTALAQRSNRLVNRGCTSCHQQIHGSNHPSGNAFAR